MFILIERKQKKNNFKSGLHTIRVKQFQEVNFLALIRCCVVIEQKARAFVLRVQAQIKHELSVTTNSGYRWYPTCAPGPDYHKDCLRKAL